MIGVLDRPLTWLITGPLGHLVSGMADWLELAARLARARLTGRRLDGS